MLPCMLGGRRWPRLGGGLHGASMVVCCCVAGPDPAGSGLCGRGGAIEERGGLRWFLQPMVVGGSELPLRSWSCGLGEDG